VVAQQAAADTRGTAGAVVAAASPAAQAPAARVEPADTIDLAGLQDRFQAVVQRVAPAIVSISSVEDGPDEVDGLNADGINPDRLARLLDVSDRTVGTGAVIDPDGYIVTNDHVVAHAKQLWVTTNDRKVLPALVVGSDPRSDLAVLKVPARDLPVVRFAKGEVRRGQWTIAVGNPYGLAADGNFCVCVGVVSATGKSLPKLSGKEDRLYSNLIQTTAQINPGNSGGPLFDLNGEVIGVNTAVILPQKQTNGIGFAIPTGARFREVIEQLKDGREVVYGYLGIKSSTPTARERRDVGLS
jgi:serine protease Do